MDHTPEQPEYQPGQQVELRRACGPFRCGQIVTITAVLPQPAPAPPAFILVVGRVSTMATAAAFGAREGRLFPVDDQVAGDGVAGDGVLALVSVPCQG